MSITVYCFVWFFFFFKQKTAYEMRISDWSSDVCSSDLREAGALHRFRAEVIERFDAEFPRAIVEHEQVPLLDVGGDEEVQRRGLIDIGRAVGEIGRAAWRERVCQYVYI